MPENYAITESIPVADHVYKYLVKRYGGNTLTATRNDIIGNIVLSSLNRNSDIKLAKPKFNKLFHVVIRENHYLRNGVFIGVKHGQVFNSMVDKLFRDEMYFHVFINNSEDKDKFLDGMRKYLNFYDITEDDIKLESLYRDFKRKKEEYNLIKNN